MPLVQNLGIRLRGQNAPSTVVFDAVSCALRAFLLGCCLVAPRKGEQLTQQSRLDEASLPQYPRFRNLFLLASAGLALNIPTFPIPERKS